MVNTCTQNMENESLVRLLVKLTINKATQEDKHPFDVLEEVKRQFEMKRLEEDANKQTDSLTISAN